MFRFLRSTQKSCLHWCSKFPYVLDLNSGFLNFTVRLWHRVQTTILSVYQKENFGEKISRKEKEAFWNRLCVRFKFSVLEKPNEIWICYVPFKVVCASNFNFWFFSKNQCENEKNEISVFWTTCRNDLSPTLRWETQLKIKFALSETLDDGVFEGATCFWKSSILIENEHNENLKT